MGILKLQRTARLAVALTVVWLGGFLGSNHLVADILIDDFVVNQGPISDSTANGIPVIDGPLAIGTGTDMTGLQRTITVNKDSGPAAVIEPRLEVATGGLVYTHSATGAITGSFSSVWTWTAPTDLTGGGTLFGVLLEAVGYASSLGTDVLGLTVTFTAPGSTAIVAIPITPPSSLFVPFTSFSNPATFLNATGLTISATTNNRDFQQFQLGAVRVITPEPSSVVLIAAGSGILGLVGWRRRKRLSAS